MSNKDRKYMTVVKTSPGQEVMHYPSYIEFNQNEKVEVTVQVGLSLTNRWDFDEVKEAVVTPKKKSKRR